MLAESIHRDAAGARVSLADCKTQAETNGHVCGVVTEVETTSADRKSMEPVAAMRCCHCQQSDPMIWLAITTEQVIIVYYEPLIRHITDHTHTRYNDRASYHCLLSAVDKAHN